jgi:hypothetical protein
MHIYICKHKSINSILIKFDMLITYFYWTNIYIYIYNEKNVVFDLCDLLMEFFEWNITYKHI